jgi:hypothetical protein
MRPGQIISFLSVFIAISACSGDSPEPARKTLSAVSLEADSSHSFARLTSEEREQLRERLMKEGKYDCCVRPGCTECIGERDSCGCYIAIKAKDPICGECFHGYKEGIGKLKMASILELEKIRNEAKMSN